MTSPMPRPQRSHHDERDAHDGFDGTNGSDRFDAQQRLMEICRGLSVAPGIAIGFIDDYLRMLPERIERIDRDLDAQDRDETVVALLSLDSSSTMLGAFGLSEVAQRLRTDLEQGATSVTDDDTTALHREADRARSELTAVREYVAEHH